MSAMRPYEILHVEDNPADSKMIHILFSECKSRCQIAWAQDGEIALNYLFKRNGYEQVSRPDIVLLDLNVPIRNGREILREMKGSSELKNIPVIVLTTSNSQRDRQDCYDLGAASFISKPIELEWLDRIVKGIEMYWLTVVDLPSKPCEKNRVVGGW
jgi:two-component system, chemotaxis family, response regulator Rcp1